MRPALKLHNQRMLELMAHAITNNIAGIDTEEKFLYTIGFYSRNNVAVIKRGDRSFTTDFISEAIRLYGVDANYFFKNKSPMYPGRKLVAIKELNHILSNYTPLRHRK